MEVNFDQKQAFPFWRRGVMWWVDAPDLFCGKG